MRGARDGTTPKRVLTGDGDRYDGTPVELLPEAEHFDVAALFKQFGGDMRRFAWRDMACDDAKLVPDAAALRAREHELALGDSPFAQRMAIMIVRRGDEQVRTSGYDLPKWLEVAAEDDQQAGSVDIWFLVSRGYQVLPRGAEHPRQCTNNYPSANDNPDEMDAEIGRLHTADHIKEYSVAAREAGYGDVPVVCILACGMVIKLTKAGIKLRLVCDGSAPHDGTSLNDVMDVPPCRLTSVEKAAATCSKYGWVFTIDESDAYMQTPCSAWSVRYLGIRWRGVLYAFTVMNFGLSSACTAQQGIAVFLHRALRRRLVAGGLHCNPTSGYDQHQVALPPINEARQKTARLATKMFKNRHRALLDGHPAMAHAAAHDDAGVAIDTGTDSTGATATATSSTSMKILGSKISDSKIRAPDFELQGPEHVQARAELDRLIKRERRAGRRIDSCSGLQQYLDDFFHACTTRRAGWWTMLQALALFNDLRVRVNMKPGKTDCPSQRLHFLGISGDLRAAFCLFLDKERVDGMLEAIAKAIADEGATVGELATLIGLMVFCSAVVEARPYYRSLLDILGENCYDQHGKWCKYKKGFFIKFSADQLRNLRAWSIVLKHYNGTDICRGLRRAAAPFEVYSDSSGSGLAWSYAGRYGVELVPKGWAKFVFARKESHVRILQGRLEAWGSLLGMRYAIPRLSGMGMTLTVRSDSSCFIYQARKMSSSDSAVQPILCEIMWLAAVHGVRLDFVHLPAASDEIGFVDALSRETQTDAPKRAAIMAAGKAKAAVEFAQSSRMGVHNIKPLERPDLVPFLEAERCQALNFSAEWSPQQRDALDAVLAEWTVHRPKVKAYECI